MKRVSIDPITRLEGHGKIDIFLDERGEVANAYLQVPELRGFERFCVGRPAEDMPNLTARICGVCPEAHHMASTKALDALFRVEPPPTAKKLRELLYSIFYTTDHTFYLPPRWVRRLLERSGFELTLTRGVGLWPLGWPCPTTLSYQVVYVAVPRRSA